MDKKKTYKPFIVLTIIAFFIACTPFFAWVFLKIVLPGWTTHCPAGGYCGGGYFEGIFLSNILNSLLIFVSLSFLIWIVPLVKYLKNKNKKQIKKQKK